MGKTIRFIAYILIFIGLISSSSFAEDEIFKINNVSVDITDTNSLNAKNNAIIEAKKTAFNLLLERVSMLNDSDILSLDISVEDISSIISDFDISNEKFSDVRYKGTFNFNFNPTKTSDFFKEKEISFTSIKSRPVLIIPIWVGDDYNRYSDSNILLWEDNNLWKTAWSQFPNDSFLVPTKLPLGDITDLQEISIENAISGNIESIEDIKKRYNISDVVVAIAVKKKDGLLINIKRYGSSMVSSQNSIFIEGTDKTYKDILSEGVKKVNNELGRMWKEKTIVDPNKVSYIDISVNISSVDELNKIKNLFGNLNLIKNYKENFLTKEKAIFDVYYRGAFYDLKLALAQLGLYVEKTDVYSCTISWK